MEAPRLATLAQHLSAGAESSPPAEPEQPLSDAQLQSFIQQARADPTPPHPTPHSRLHRQSVLALLTLKRGARRGS